MASEDIGKDLDLDRVREVFESSQDFTIGIEEEFALVNPQTLELEHRYEDLIAVCSEDDVLADSAKPELIESAIEIRSGRGESFADAVAMQQARRARLFRRVEEMGMCLAATGTHPWADYLDQRIIGTDRYRRLWEELGYVLLRNNAWSLHVHVGIRGPDRAIAVCDSMREVLPALLAVSANSPFLDRHDTGLASARTEIFTRVFPRCGIHEPFGSWAGYAEYVDTLVRTSSIMEATQLWWSVRPHHEFGTVEVRICDAQSEGQESLGLAALIAACVAQAALDFDEGRLGPPLGANLLEENLWRATRSGLDGKLIDFERGEEVEAEAVLERLVAWTAPARKELGVEVDLSPPNGAQRAQRQLADGMSIEEIYRDAIEQTRRTYVTEEVVG